MQTKYSFDAVSIYKCIKGFLIAGGGAGIIYLLQFAVNADFGNWTPTVVAIAAVAINIIREFIKGEKKD